MTVAIVAIVASPIGSGLALLNSTVVRSLQDRRSTDEALGGRAATMLRRCCDGRVQSHKAA